MRGESRSEYFGRLLRQLRHKGVQAGIVVLFLAMASESSRAQSWTWTVETVDKVADFTSLGVDHQGNVHVGYTDNASHTLKYAFRSAETSRWFTLLIDKSLQNTTTRLAVDSEGNPHICYPDWPTLKYAHWNGRKWIIQEISPGGAKEYTCSLAIAPDGTPYVSWYQVRSPTGGFYYHIRTAAMRDGAWFARTVDYDGEAGKWNWTALDKQGRPYISYSTFPTGELKLARWNGKEWEIEFIDSVNRDPEKFNRGMGNCLRMDPQGKFHVSYFGTSELRYATLEGDRWTIQRVDDVSALGSWVGYLSSLDFDHAGNPHISYDDGGALKHAYWDGKSWHVQIIALAGAEPYRYSSLGIAPDDTIYVSFRNSADASLKVAVGHPTTPTSTAAAAQVGKKD